MPCSRVYFKSGSGQIGVITANVIDTSLDAMIDINKAQASRDRSVTVHLARWITIDETRGAEIILTIRKGVGVSYPVTIHTVTYLKHGLMHVVVLTCRERAYLGLQSDFVRFLHSYRSVDPGVAH